MAARNPLWGLETVPSEVLCHIVELLDLEAFLRLISADPRCFRLFKCYRSSLILPILQRDFSPLDGLLRVVHATQRSTKLEELPSTAAWRHVLDRNDFNSVHQEWTSLLRICAVIKRWEAVFPRLRFARRPQMTRSLRTRENHRLRRALYTWWIYALLFHGELQRPSLWMPDMFSSDARLDMLRTLSTTELYELVDFWHSLRSAVGTDLCPSVDSVRANAVSVVPLRSRLCANRPRGRYSLTLLLPVLAGEPRLRTGRSWRQSSNSVHQT
jgi:hypothetical protein